MFQLYTGWHPNMRVSLSTDCPSTEEVEQEITVKVENSTLYNDKEFNYNFTVDKNNNYSLDVNITKGAYGENTTIEVTAPAGIAVVNLTIEEVNYPININIPLFESEKTLISIDKIISLSLT